MNAETILASSGSTAGVMLILGMIYKMFLHSRCRSKCCGKEVMIQTDLSPPKDGKDTFGETKKDVKVEV
jgi:hypothetical protein